MVMQGDKRATNVNIKMIKNERNRIRQLGDGKGIPIISTILGDGE